MYAKGNISLWNSEKKENFPAGLKVSDAQQKDLDIGPWDWLMKGPV